MRTSPVDVKSTSPYGLMCTPSDMSLRDPENILIWFNKAKKRPRDKDFHINVMLLKLSPQHSRLAIQKGGNKNYLP